MATARHPSHVDTSDPSLLAVRMRCWRSKRRVAPILDLQLVAFPQDGVLRTLGRRRKPPRGSTGASTSSAAFRISSARYDGAASVKLLLCEIAAERGKLVDMHCDESDDPLSRHIETLAHETQRLGLARPRDRFALHRRCIRWTITTSAKLIPLIAESR